jgi:hypothetical protein
VFSVSVERVAKPETLPRKLERLTPPTTSQSTSQPPMVRRPEIETPAPVGPGRRRLDPAWSTLRTRISCTASRHD